MKPVIAEMQPVTRYGARIVIKRTHGEDNARIKEIPGARALFSKLDGEKHFEFWHVPLDLNTAKMLREKFPDMELGPKLTAWGRRKKKDNAATRRLHTTVRAEPVPIPIIKERAPAIYKAMMNRGYQTIVPAFAKRVGSHYNADQPGAGKTIEELGALVECEITGKFLIIAPRKAIRATWGPQIAEWFRGSVFDIEIVFADSEEGGGPVRAEVIREFMEEPVKPMSMQFLLINPEMTRWIFICPGDPKTGEKKCRNGNGRSCAWRKKHTKAPLYPEINNKRKPWDAIILDETHKYLMNANERAGNVSQVGFGLQQLPSKGYKVGCSGTPFKGKPRRFWTVLHWLDRKKYSGQGKWQEAYFETEENYFVRSGKVITDVMRKDRIDMFNDDLDQIMVRRTKRELHKMNPAWAPPDKQYVDIFVNMDAKQKRAYNQMRDNAEAYLDQGVLSAMGRLAEMTRLKQFATSYGKMVPSAAKKCGNDMDPQEDFIPTLPSCKWDWIKEDFLEPRGIFDNDGELKVVIAAVNVRFLQAIADELDRVKVPYMFIHGGMKSDIELTQKRWQRKYRPGDARVMLLSTMAGGTSINLDAADDLVLVDETWTPDDQEQVEDRVHRTSRTDHQVTIYRLRTADTIDELIARSSDRLDEIQKMILDGRRGVQYTKNFMNAA